MRPPFNVRFLTFRRRFLYIADPDEYKYELKDILGMEMKVLEALDYYLVVFHPYQSLSEYVHSPLLSPFQKSYNLHLFCLIVCVANREEMISSVNDDTCKKIALFPFNVLDVFHYIETLDRLYISLVRVLYALMVSKPIYSPGIEFRVVRKSTLTSRLHSFDFSGFCKMLQ